MIRKTLESNSQEVVATISYVDGDATIYRKSNLSANLSLINEGDIVYKDDVISTSSDSTALIDVNSTPLLLSSLETFQFTPSALNLMGNIFTQASLSTESSSNIFNSLKEALESGGNIETLLEKTSADDDAASSFDNNIIIWPRNNSVLLPDTDTYRVTTQKNINNSTDDSFLFDESYFITKTQTNDDNVVLFEDKTLSNINVLANDTLTFGDSIGRFDNITSNGGIITLAANSTFSYRPADNFNGNDSFTYTVIGITGQETISTVNIVVAAVDDGKPDAADDIYDILEDQPLRFINLLINDTLPDEASISSYSAVSANGGTVTQINDGIFTYTPAANYNGSDSFTYTIQDSDGQTDTATVTINITPVTDGTPDAKDDVVSTDEDIPLTLINPLLNDILPDEATIIDFQSVSLHGASISQESDGTLTYTPIANYNGVDSFTYTIKDSDGQTDTASITINIAPVNDAPINHIVEQAVVMRNGSLSFNESNGYLLTVSDLEENIVQTELSVSHGILNISYTSATLIGNDTDNIIISGTQAEINDAISTLTYHPDTDFGGFDRLDIKTTDSDGSTDNDSISVKVQVDAIAATFNENVSDIPYSTGLTVSQINIYETNVLPLANSQTIENDIAVSGASPVTTSKMTQGAGAIAQENLINSSNAIVLDSENGHAYSLTGLIYLEANNQYNFSGSRDDALYVELGGQTMVETIGNSAGYFSTRANDNTIGITESIFIPTVSGYYTLEVYAANVLGLGTLALNLSVNDTTFTLSADNFSLYSNAHEVIAAGGLIDEFTSNIGENPDGGYFAHNDSVDIIGIEGQRINLTNFSITQDPDDTLINLWVEIPIGSTLYAGEGQEFFATAGNNTIDILNNGWDLTALSLSLPDAVAGDLVDINITAVTQSVSLDTTEADTSLSISILPVNFTGNIDFDITLDPTNTNNDLVITGSGFNDTLQSEEAGATVILGHDGNDHITGNDDNNTLFGGDGNDTIIAGAGDDFIFGGRGADSLVGGDGIDKYIWQENDGDGSTDHITNFTLGDGGDMLDLRYLLDGETADTITNFIQLNDNILAIDINGDGSGFNDLFIELDDATPDSLDDLIKHNIDYDSGRTIVRGSTIQDEMYGREYNGETGNEDFYGNGGGDGIWGRGGADRYIVEADDFNETPLPRKADEAYGTIRIWDLFTFGRYDGVSESDAVDLSDILIGENYDNITNYLTIDTRSPHGGTFINVDIHGDGSGTDFNIHITQDNLDIEAELGYTDDTNQLAILQHLIDYGNLVID
jgi:hypothetical protein